MLKKTVNGFALLAFAILIAAVSSLPAAHADEWVYNAERITTELGLSTRLIIEAENQGYSVEFLRVNLSFFPKDGDYQDVRALTTEPKAKSLRDSLVFNFDSPDAGIKEIILNATIETASRLVKVSDKVDFPIDTPSNLKKYTLPREMIDSDNPKIMRKAGELASGEDDLMVVLYRIASWISGNLEYDYSTTSEAVLGTKKASWVFENKKGVCDEYTSLFIAMVRSLGIPAKYVSGLAYTNMLNINDWGPHAWAEVYVPGSGWVPYDVTYGQLGFTDASHIKMKESMDSGEPSVSYSWKYHNALLVTTGIDTQVKLREKGRILDPPVRLSVRPVKKSVGFGSYNLIEISVKNLRGYYISTGIQLAQTQELTIEGDTSRIVLLKPFETKKLYWIVRVDSGLKRNYVYTIPIYAESTRNASDEQPFESSEHSASYSREEMQVLLESLRKKEAKSYTKKITMNCTSDKRKYYLYEEAKVSCTLKNRGNTPLEGISVCMKEECRTVDLPIGQEADTGFTATFDKAGEIDLIVAAEKDDLFTEDMIVVFALDNPGLELAQKEIQGGTAFGDDLTLSATLKKTSYSTPKDLRVTFSIGDTELSAMQAKEITIDQKYQLKLKTDMLPARNNTIMFRVVYHDDNGREYELSEGYEININTISLTQRLVLLFNRFELWVQSLV